MYLLNFKVNLQIPIQYWNACVALTQCSLLPPILKFFLDGFHILNVLVSQKTNERFSSFYFFIKQFIPLIILINIGLVALSSANTGPQARNAILVSRRQVGHPKLVNIYFFHCTILKENLMIWFVFAFCSMHKQGNPVLKHIKNIRWIFSDIVPDYILGQSSCALYLRFVF